MRNSQSIKILISLFSILLIGGLFNQASAQDRAVQDTISSSRNWQPMPAELKISTASKQMNLQVPTTQSLTTPVNGFADEFAPANWTFDPDGGDGSVDTGDAPNSISLISSDDQSGTENNSTYCITIPGGNEGVLEFDWNYESDDVDGPQYDPFGYIVNGNTTQLTDDNGADIQSGNVSFSINAGDQFCFLARSTDQQFGRAETQVTNFSFTPPAPTEENIFTTSGTWTAPEDVFEITVEVWGGGGGGSIEAAGNSSKGGGGGGAYSTQTISVIPGNTYNFTVGLGGTPGNAGGDSFFGDGNEVLASGGSSGNQSDGGAGGTATSSIGSVSFSGGTGGNGQTTGNPPPTRAGGGGGGSAFTNSNGGNGVNGAQENGGDGGIGTGNGGEGSVGDQEAQPGQVPGGGGGGGGRNGNSASGADGQIIITFELPAQPDPTQTTITADPDILVADGSSTSNITVQAVDEDGVNITDGGATVTLSATDGTLSPVTDNADGTYSSTFTSSNTPGVVTISGTIDGDTITDTAEIELTPASGTVYYSIQSGDFDNPNAWSFTGHDGDPAGFAPGSSDIIFIGGSNSTDHNISLVQDFTLNEPGELNVVNTGDGAGILSTENFVISGTGEFTLENGSTLEIGSADGISTTASAGNIQTNTRTFGEEANYVYNGQSEQITGDALPTDVNNLTIDNSNNVLANQSYRVNGTLNLLDGAFVIGDGLSLIANNKNVTSGELTYQLEIYGQPGYRMLSSPIAADFDNFLNGVLTQGYTGASLSGDLQPNVLWYEESFEGTDNQRWRAPTSASNQIVPGRGYFVYMFGDVESDNRYNDPLPYLLDVNGLENEGTGGQIDLNVTYTAEADTGWNMVGNPYGAAIDWDHPSWTKTNIDPTIYVWDPNTNQYLTWNGSVGDIDDGILAPFQSFWIKADENPELIVSEDAKTFGGSFSGKATQQENAPLISINARYSRRYQSTAHFSFSESASYGLDESDAYKLLPPPGVSDYLEVYSLTNRNDRLATNHLPRRFGSSITIPFSVNAYKDGFPISDDIELNFSNFENIPEAWEVELVNLQTGQTYNVRESKKVRVDMSHLAEHSDGTRHKTGYEVITRDKDSHIQFELNINPGSDAADLPNSFELKQNYPNPFNPSTRIRFDLPIQSEVKFEIYDMLGRKVATIIDETLSAGSYERVWDASNLSSGVYITRLVTSNGVFTNKMTLIK
ncbi:invasin domain 3-containing protein [Rhodohalobacter barkolensis]|uniref:Big-1 domain-containing protein n=1 Tax=Rhodohalobacter barkolensis TaxID=2053187 RepID=A0A2N0VFQ9_9BACT|nr:invasin domain 3-containing protein [Rhodohalobacter barkolensis]PKD42978.1 hypothetical protein CWD77_10085 [Rhodohalobacter barkolensis]